MERNLDFEQEDDFAHLVKKAKRKSLKRSIIVSLIVTIVLFVLLWAFIYIGQYFMYEKMQMKSDEVYDEFALMGANVFPSSTAYDHFFVASRTQTSAYKEVNGHLIDWGKKSFFYTIIGTSYVIENSNWIDLDGVTYLNNHKMASFHLPGEETKQTNSEVAYLETLPDFYSVEVAVSFKEDLPVSTVSSVFPNAKWLWVIEDGLYEKVAATKKDDQAYSLFIEDDYSERMGDDVYGFPITEEDGKDAFLQSAANYQMLVKQFVSEDNPLATSIYKKLEKYESAKLPIAGVVLTGTVADVLAQIKNKHVRVVRAGIVIPY